MIIISAMSYDRVIGLGAGMPWNVPEEYQQFLRFVEGQTVIMGRRSYEIFGDDLTSAHHIVVSRSMKSVPGAVVCAGIEEAVETARSFGKTVFSAGGGSIYAQTIPLAHTMYLSYIKGDFEGTETHHQIAEGNRPHEKRRRDHEPTHAAPPAFSECSAASNPAATAS